jgi:hypothetical protein
LAVLNHAYSGFTPEYSPNDQPGMADCSLDVAYATATEVGSVIDAVCKEIMRRLGIRLFVETGTDMAETVGEVAQWFAEFDTSFGRVTGFIVTGARGYHLGAEPIRYPVFQGSSDSDFRIFSVDIDRPSFEGASKIFAANGNIRFCCGNSPDFLRTWIASKDRPRFSGSGGREQFPAASALTLSFLFLLFLRLFFLT